MIPDTSISGRRVARELTDLIGRRGRPDMIVSDHGTEFTSNAILALSKENRAEWINDYNTARPHSSLNCRIPAAFAEVLTATGSYAAFNGGFASPTVAQPAPNGVTETAETLIAAE